MSRKRVFRSSSMGKMVRILRNIRKPDIKKVSSDMAKPSIVRQTTLEGAAVRNFNVSNKKDVVRLGTVNKSSEIPSQRTEVGTSKLLRFVMNAQEGLGIQKFVMKDVLRVENSTGMKSITKDTVDTTRRIPMTTTQMMSERSKSIRRSIRSMDLIPKMKGSLMAAGMRVGELMGNRSKNLEEKTDLTMSAGDTARTFLAVKHRDLVVNLNLALKDVVPDSKRVLYQVATTMKGSKSDVVRNTNQGSSLSVLGSVVVMSLRLETACREDLVVDVGRSLVVGKRDLGVEMKVLAAEMKASVAGKKSLEAEMKASAQEEKKPSTHAEEEVSATKKALSGPRMKASTVAADTGKAMRTSRDAGTGKATSTELRVLLAMKDYLAMGMVKGVKG